MILYPERPRRSPRHKPRLSRSEWTRSMPPCERNKNKRIHKRPMSGTYLHLHRYDSNFSPCPAKSFFCNVIFIGRQCTVSTSRSVRSAVGNWQKFYGIFNKPRMCTNIKIVSSLFVFFGRLTY